MLSRLSRYSTWLMVATLGVFLLATIGCSDDKKSTDDAGTDTDTDTDSDSDSDTDSDTGTGDHTCDREGFDTSLEFAMVTASDLRLYQYDNDDYPYSLARLLITNPLPSTGTYDLEGVNYSECEHCFTITTDCEHGLGCQKVFYTRSGTLEISAQGGEGDQLTGVLREVVMEEVDIDSSTGVSTPVDGGETWWFDEIAFDREILGFTEGSCAKPPNKCIGEIVYDFELENCETGDMMTLSEIGDGDKALWLVLTTGWCPHCADWIENTVIPQDDAEAADGLEVVYILGENASGGEPSQSYCQTYAEQYTTDVGRFFIDYDSYSFATFFSEVWPYFTDEYTFGLPWNGVLDAQTLEYMYADRPDLGTGAGTELQSVIDDLLAD